MYGKHINSAACCSIYITKIKIMYGKHGIFLKCFFIEYKYIAVTNNAECMYKQA